MSIQKDLKKRESTSKMNIYNASLANELLERGFTITRLRFSALDNKLTSFVFKREDGIHAAINKIKTVPIRDYNIVKSRTNRNIVIINSPRLAGYLMMRGFICFKAEPDRNTPPELNYKIYLFQSRDDLLEAIENYKENSTNIHKNLL